MCAVCAVWAGWAAGARAGDGGPCAVALEPALSAFQGELPVFALDTCGAALASGEVEGAFQLGEARGRLRARPLGHSSRTLPKQHLALTLAAPAALLGMPAGARWALHGPCADKTLIRNALVYGWARRMGMPSPRARFVELFASEDGGPVGLDDQRGVYLLLEWLEPHPDRVPVDPAGGFLFRRDKGDGSGPEVTTSRGERFMVDFPRPAAPERLAALRARLEEVEEQVMGSASLEALARLIDVRSFVDHAVLVEVTRNADGFKNSAFFHLDREGPLRSGPPFDFDAALRNDKVAVDPTGWQHRFPRPGRSPWWPALWRRPELQRAFADRYAELRAGFLETEAVEREIDGLVAALGGAAARNFQRWPVLEKPLLTNPDAAGRYELEVARMKSWLELRLEWLDQQMVAAPRVEGGAIAALEGEVFFGAGDPALGGGAPAERLSAPERRVLVQAPARSAPCGEAVTLNAVASRPADQVWVETAAPPDSEFEVKVQGARAARALTLPIRWPHRELGSAVDEGGLLRLTFRREVKVPAGPLKVQVRAGGTGGRCRTPEVRVLGIREGRWKLPAGAAVLRARRGEAWSAPLRLSAPGPGAR